MESKYLEFVEMEMKKGFKTKVWSVNNKQGQLLGSIKWHAPWRQYCYETYDYIVMAKSCLLDICKFIELHKDDRNE